MTKELNISLCTKCGKGWPKGFSGAVSSMKHYGYFDHFPNCPEEKYDNKTLEK